MKKTPKKQITQIQICNGTKTDVTVYVVLGATPGCLQDVTQIPYITSGSGLVGSFVLKTSTSTSPWAPANIGFNANLTFGSMPINCPDSAMPYGVNLFEFIVNNGFQAGAPQETIDISCVAGVNSIIKADLSGPVWNAGPTEPTVTTIQNSVPPNNYGLVGVYPYGCDDCTSIVAPPVCSDKPFPYEQPQDNAICNVQRDAKKYYGGLVKVTYMGPAGIPA